MLHKYTLASLSALNLSPGFICKNITQIPHSIVRMCSGEEQCDVDCMIKFMSFWVQLIRFSSRTFFSQELNENFSTNDCIMEDLCKSRLNVYAFRTFLSSFCKLLPLAGGEKCFPTLTIKTHSIENLGVITKLLHVNPYLQMQWTEV